MPLATLLGLAGVVALVVLFLSVGICCLQRVRIGGRAWSPPRRSSRTGALRLRRISVGSGFLLAALLFLTRDVQPVGTPLVTHRCALVALAGFLLCAQHLQVRAVVACIRGEDAGRCLIAYQRLRRLTEVAPAPIALVLLASGLRLVAQFGHSLREGWLLVLVSAFGFLFFDGILGFTPLVRDLHRCAVRSVELGDDQDLRRKALGAPANATFLVHFASLPFLVLVGWFRPMIPNPIAVLLVALEDRVATFTRVPRLGPQATVLAVLGIVGVSNLAVRWLAGRSARPRLTRLEI